MPDLRGQSVRDVARTCSQLGLKLEAKGEGRAIRHSPAAGQEVSSGQTVRVEFEAPIGGVETPAQAEKRAVVEELDSARQSLESDPAVRALRETFGATLLPDSVRPLK